MRKHPFTLIEILVSVAIIAILAGMLIGGLNYASRRADTAKTQSQLEELQLAFDAFKHDNGYFPISTSAADVQFFLNTSATPDVFSLRLGGSNYPFEKRGGKPYFEMQVSSTPAPVLDTWDQAIRYQCPGTHNPQSYDLWSYGPDRQDGTDDDLTNWKQN